MLFYSLLLTSTLYSLTDLLYFGKKIIFSKVANVFEYGIKNSADVDNDGHE